jgi:hypothetical protein
MKIDLKAENTETKWQETIDRVILKATPKWFEWLGWVLILGALKYLSALTNHIALRFVIAISWVLFLFYIYAFFYQIEIENIPFIKSKKVARRISILISALLGLCFFLLLNSIIQMLSKKGT